MCLSKLGPTTLIASEFLSRSPICHRLVIAHLDEPSKFMCIDAPESTTNSVSSGSRVDGAGRHQFSEGEKNVALFFSF